MADDPIAACAEIVARGDPDRFAATMAAPPRAREVLFPLYAFNLEVARAPWVTQEPMIAQMRLQFWADTLEEIAAGKPARAHEVAAPLSDLVRRRGIDAALLMQIVAARRRDAGREVFADQEALDGYIDSTAGNLFVASAQGLGAGPSTDAIMRDVGYASGLANWFLAAPRLEAAGWPPLPATGSGADSVARLASRGLERLARARAGRKLVPAQAVPALLSAWRAGTVLRAAAQSPDKVLAGVLDEPEILRRWHLLWRGMSQRW